MNKEMFGVLLFGRSFILMQGKIIVINNSSEMYLSHRSRTLVYNGQHPINLISDSLVLQPTLSSLIYTTAAKVAKDTIITSLNSQLTKVALYGSAHDQKAGKLIALIVFPLQELQPFSSWSVNFN